MMHGQEFFFAVLRHAPRSGSALRHAVDGGVSNADSEDGDENLQQVQQVQRSSGAALRAVFRKRRLYQGSGQTADSGIGKITASHGAQAPI